MTEEKTSKWKWGVNRWIVLALIIANLFAVGGINKPMQPHIQLPAEVIIKTNFVFFGQPFHITNTIIAMLIGDALLFLMAFAFYRSTRKENAIPKGISGAVEGLLEALYNLTESAAGKWTKTIFPIFATITLSVLVWNWMELIPGVDSIGLFDAHHVEDVSNCNFDDWNGITLVRSDPDNFDPACAAAVVPFVRVASTDLNFTIGLALISVVAVQWIGIRSLGVGYFKKFFNTSTLFSVPIFGVIDFAVGLLELVGEFAKILSFAFRLFGNIFAGSVLLFVIGSLVPVALQTGFLMLEFFVGLIQAIVFGMLTMVFMSQATVGHGDDHAEEHH